MLKRDLFSLMRDAQELKEIRLHAARVFFEEFSLKGTQTFVVELLLWVTSINGTSRLRGHKLLSRQNYSSYNLCIY